MKNLHLILVLFSIASMFTSFGVYDVDATKDDNNGKANGCENGNGKVKEKNPHCEDNGPAPSTECGSDPDDCDGDGMPNSEDWCPEISIGDNKQKDSDWDGDGSGNGIDDFPCDPTRA